MAFAQSSLQKKPLRKSLLSVIVPAREERENLPDLLERLSAALEPEPYPYEILIVDDHSEDDSEEYVASVKNRYPVRFITKNGKAGKSYSILQGIDEAKGNIIAVIDADLQYPPEAIPDMVRLLRSHDIAVANRTVRHTSWYRTFLSKAYRNVFGRLLLKLNVDVQSGLKVFYKDILEHFELDPSPWGFDSQFLYKAKLLGCAIGQVDITFGRRIHGKSHVNSLSTSIELAWESLKLRFQFLPRYLFAFLYTPSSYRPAWRSADEDFLFLPETHSIKRHLHRETVSFIVASAVLAAVILWEISVIVGLPVLLVLSGLVSAFYLGIILFKLWVVYQSTRHKPLSYARRAVQRLSEDDLPVYTILIPLYQEAAVIPQIIKAMTAIDYPPEKLDVIITLEEYDHETMDAIRAAKPPKHFKTLILPNVKPKTKPKALNVALLEAKGEFLVIFDAEIIPDADQLKKAVLAFRDHPELAALQTRLDHYNRDQNLITKLFNAEFSFYYDLFLPGLQRLGYPLALSGHSMHFRTAALREVGGWDPYNVAEDCDVGIRLFRNGYRSDILDSLSQEEATSDWRAWTMQRSRWIKGFIQTTIVHLRHPFAFKDEIGGWKNFFAFLITVPGSVMLNMLNMIYTALLILWLITASPLIQAYFPGPILYVSMFSFVTGNFVFTLLNLLGSYERKRFSMVKYSLLSFVYWVMLSYATVRAIVQLVLRPHHWEKTKHGQHLAPLQYAVS